MTDSVSFNSERPTTIVNPFRQQMLVPERILLNRDVFEAPLPLSSAREHPDLLSTFQGIFHFSWPCLHVVALEGNATTQQLKSRRWISLIFIAAGAVTIHQENAWFSGAAGDCLFLPESSALWQSSTYSVVCLMFPPEQLTDGLKLMTYQDLGWKFSGDWDFSKPICRKASDGAIETSLLSTLRHLLHLTSELAMTHPVLFTRLGISNQLCLLTALLASPSLSRPLISEENIVKQGGVADAIEELTNYMTNNLAEPLNLTVLERFSHYSRRSLQYAFREKFGCTITQWIRSQRLDKAYNKLRNSVAGDTVTSIANGCGYRSISLFSIEFQKRFHTKPSILLRENQSRDKPEEE